MTDDRTDIEKLYSGTRIPPAGGFWQVRAGDRVTRMLAGTIPQELTVTKVDKELIHCCGPDGVNWCSDGCHGWTFDRATGAEVDMDLGWGAGRTGSFLK
jgi:hypothetical protein